MEKSQSTGAHEDPFVEVTDMTNSYVRMRKLDDQAKRRRPHKSV